MFELVIRDCEVRFKTDETDYERAYEQFVNACEQIGLEIYGGYDGVIRNQYGEEI